MFFKINYLLNLLKRLPYNKFYGSKLNISNTICSSKIQIRQSKVNCCYLVEFFFRSGTQIKLTKVGGSQSLSAGSKVLQISQKSKVWLLKAVK